MAFSLNQIVPWGRSFDEYSRMFALTDDDLSGRILGCGDGPAGFNAVMHRQGRAVVSADPLYQFSAAQIRERIDEACPMIMRQLLANQDAYVWTTIASPEVLLRTRREAMEGFLADFDIGKREGRYVACALPHLPFADDTFDLVLCSQLLFTYSEHLSLEFHQRAIVEMAAKALEVRIFPLVDMAGKASPHLAPTCDLLRQQGYQVATVTVDYEFQRGGKEMLCVAR